MHSTASSSDLYRSAKFRVQRTCGVEQFATRLVWEYVTVYVQDETEDASAQTITMITKTTRRCCGVFSWFRRRDINYYTYLLTYLLTVYNTKYRRINQSLFHATDVSDHNEVFDDDDDNNNIFVISAC